MNKEEINEYQRNYRENHKDKISNQKKKYYENHKEEKLEYGKKYYYSHKEKVNKYCKKYRDSNKEKISEYNRNYYNEKKKSLVNIRHVYKYFEKNYSRFISLENYITIMKADGSLKQSIMCRLGKGLIDEDEAVALSGMVLFDEEKEELINIFNNLNIKRE